MEKRANPEERHMGVDSFRLVLSDCEIHIAVTFSVMHCVINAYSYSVSVQIDMVFP